MKYERFKNKQNFTRGSLKAILSVLVHSCKVQFAMTAQLKPPQIHANRSYACMVMTTGTNAKRGVQGRLVTIQYHREKNTVLSCRIILRAKRKNNWISAHPLEIDVVEKLITSLARLRGLVIKKENMPYLDMPPAQVERVVAQCTAAIKYQVPANIMLAVEGKRGWW